MTKTRREFPPEFKRGTVALLGSRGRALMQVATELGISPSMLRNWRAAVHGDAPGSRTATSSPSPVASSADQAARIVRLKRDLERTRMERDVPREAIGIFAEGPR